MKKHYSKHFEQMVLKKMFMPDGKTPRCQFCGKAMKNYLPIEGRFKGKVQEHNWICNCANYPKNIIISVG